jgi:hypothetical protein
MRILPPTVTKPHRKDPRENETAPARIIGSSAEIRALIAPPPKISHANSDAARANGLIPAVISKG